MIASVVWSPRPQLVSLVLIALVGYLLYLYKWRGKDRLWALPLVFILWFGVVVSLLFWGRGPFCGWLCPFGALQELFGKIGKLVLRGRRPQVPAVLDKPARFLKYGLLVFFTVWTWQAAELVMRPYDPWVAFMHVTSSELWAEFAVGAGVLGVSVVGSIVYDRFFCKYLCPTGAFLGAISRLSVFKVRRNEEKCGHCHACTRHCPTHIDVENTAVVKSAECYGCLTCVSRCPAEGALNLTVSTGKKVSVVKAALFPVVLIALFYLVIGIGMATGKWHSKVPYEDYRQLISEMQRESSKR